MSGSPNTHPFGNITALYQLTKEELMQMINQVILEYQRVHKAEVKSWISGAEAMEILGVSSKTTLQKLRNEGLIRFSRPTSKNLLYCRKSILAYIESKAEDTF